MGGGVIEVVLLAIMLGLPACPARARARFACQLHTLHSTNALAPPCHPERLRLGDDAGVLPVAHQPVARQVCSQVSAARHRAVGGPVPRLDGCHPMATPAVMCQPKSPPQGPPQGLPHGPASSKTMRAGPVLAAASLVHLWCILPPHTHKAQFHPCTMCHALTPPPAIAPSSPPPSPRYMAAHLPHAAPTSQMVRTIWNVPGCACACACGLGEVGAGGGRSSSLPALFAPARFRPFTPPHPVAPHHTHAHIQRRLPGRSPHPPPAPS